MTTWFFLTSIPNRSFFSQFQSSVKFSGRTFPTLRNSHETWARSTFLFPRSSNVSEFTRETARKQWLDKDQILKKQEQEDREAVLPSVRTCVALFSMNV